MDVAARIADGGPRRVESRHRATAQTLASARHECCLAAEVDGEHCLSLKQVGLQREINERHWTSVETDLIRMVLYATCSLQRQRNQ